MRQPPHEPVALADFADERAMQITSLYASILAVLFAVLSVRTLRMRRQLSY